MVTSRTDTSPKVESQQITRVKNRFVGKTHHNSKCFEYNYFALVSFYHSFNDGPFDPHG